MGAVDIVTAELVVEVGVVDEDVAGVEASGDVGLGEVPRVVDEVDRASAGMIVVNRRRTDGNFLHCHDETCVWPRC